MLKSTPFFFLFLMTQVSLIAQDSSFVESPWNWSLRADAYYRFAKNRTASNTYPSYAHDNISLGMVDGLISYSGAKTGVLANLAFGPRAIELFGIENTNLSMIKQLYFWYSPSSKWKFTLGTTPYFLGYEWTEPDLNYVYSGSYTSSYNASSLTGLSVSYLPDEHWTIMGGVYNDPDYFSDQQDGKHVGVSVNHVNDNFNVTMDFIHGKLLQGPQQSIADFYGEYKLASHWNVSTNCQYAHLKQDGFTPAIWWSVAGYLQYLIDDHKSLSLRYEYLNDKDGWLFLSKQLQIHSITLGAKIQVGELTFMPDLRYDVGTEFIYSKKNGNISKSNPAVMLGVVYKIEK